MNEAEKQLAHNTVSFPETIVKDAQEDETNYILLRAGEDDFRATHPDRLNVKELASNVELFIGQMNIVLGQTPTEVQGFRFSEFEVSVEITSQGKIVLLGSGVEAGAKAGVKFVFKRG